MTSLTVANRSQGFTKFKQAPVCYNCKKPGYIMSACWFLKKDKESQTTHVGFVNSKHRNVTNEDTVLLPEWPVMSKSMQNPRMRRIIVVDVVAQLRGYSQEL